MHPKVFVNDRFYKVLATQLCASKKSCFCKGFLSFWATWIFHSILPSLFLSETKVLRFCENASLTSDKPNAFSMILNHFLWKWRNLLPNHLRFIRGFQPRVAFARMLLFPWEKLILASSLNRITKCYRGVSVLRNLVQAASQSLQIRQVL